MAVATHAPGSELPEPPFALEARGIRKSFGTIEVLHGVDLSLARGGVHGLVGQNGAGKSTLVKIIDGAYAADAGEVLVNGEAIGISGSGRSRKREIAMVFQEFSLIPTLSVAQNVLLSREPRGRLRLIDDRELRRRALAALARVGADVDPDREVGSLPVGARQLVEIAKALSQDASILILDEPTASLAATEIARLMAAIRALAADGISIVYISHHLDEVLAICDHVTVIRDGVVTLSTRTTETDVPEIIESMLGRSLERTLVYQPHEVDRSGPPLLRVSGLRNHHLEGISFDLHAGEVVGVAGLLGSGRTELLRAIFGIDRLDAGSIEVAGQSVHIRGPRDALRAGIALVPEDRGRAGLVREHTVGDNILMAAWRRFAHAGFIDDGSARAAATSLVEQLSIRTNGLGQDVKGLSGGNQQKVVVAKNLMARPSILLLDEPTVGVDVGSKREILTEVRQLAGQGNGIVLVSSEFEELSGMADRVLVIRDGSMVAVLDRNAGDDLSEEAISHAVQGASLAATGLAGEEASAPA